MTSIRYQYNYFSGICLPFWCSCRLWGWRLLFSMVSRCLANCRCLKSCWSELNWEKPLPSKPHGLLMLPSRWHCEALSENSPLNPRSSDLQHPLRKCPEQVRETPQTFGHLTPSVLTHSRHVRPVSLQSCELLYTLPYSPKWSFLAFNALHCLTFGGMKKALSIYPSQ